MRKAPTFTVAPIDIQPLESRTFLSAGQLDTSFDADGFAPGSWGAQAREALVLSSGKILVVGTVMRDGQFGPVETPGVARYNANGSLDTTFGVNGVSPPFGSGIEGEGRDIAVQSTGKIIVAVSDDGNSFLQRLNTDGTRDLSFHPAGGGRFANPHSLIVTPDDKIVYMDYRYNSDGSPDPTYHQQYFNFGNSFGTFYLAGNAVQPDGKIVGAGVLQLAFNRWAYAAYRRNVDGSMDTSFYGGHVYIEDPRLHPYFPSVNPENETTVGATMTLLSDGRVEIGAGSINPNSAGRASIELRAARFSNRGSVDTTFGTSGIAATGVNMVPFDVENQPDGKVVFSGWNASPADANGQWTDPNFAALRLNTNGSRDTTFQLDSRLDSQAGASFGLAIQPDNKIITVGGTQLNIAQIHAPASTAIVARLLNDGTIQPPPPPPPPPPGTQKPVRWPFGEREIIQAEDYDLGGEGVAYHDDTPGNQSGSYRANEGVDVGDITGGRVVGRADQGEWLEYTIRSPFTTTRNFSMQARYVTPKSGVTLNYLIDGVKVGSVTLAPTGSYGGTYQLASTTIAIPAGTHVLRVEFASGGNDVGNFDWFRFVAQ